MEESQQNQPAAVSTPENSTPQKLLSPKELLNQSIQIYKSRIKVLLPIFIIPSLGILILNGILGILAGLGFYIIMGRVMSGDSSGVGSLVAILFFLFVVFYFIANAILYSWGQTSLLYAIKDRAEGIGIKESFKRGRKKILSYWWIFILMNLALVFGLLLFVIPGIIFATWFSLAPYILVSEDLKGIKALKKSKWYIKGRFAAVWGRNLFMLLIFAIIYIVPSALIDLLEETIITNIVGGIYSFVVLALLIPLYLVYIYQLYLNLKSLKGEPQPVKANVSGLTQNLQ